MEHAADIDERQTAHNVGATPARPINLGRRHRHEKGSVLHPQLGVPLKGLADPLEVHELAGVGPAQTRFQAIARRGLTRFVGRDAELEQLHQARQLACDSHGQVVALVAEAGVGKSRLVHELTHSQGLEGWLVLECAAVSYGKAMSYLPGHPGLVDTGTGGPRRSVSALGTLRSKSRRMWDGLVVIAACAGLIACTPPDTAHWPIFLPPPYNT
jgi:hypothetical protein